MSPADCAKPSKSAAPCLQGSECVGPRLQSSFLNSHIYSPPNPPSGPAHSAGHPYACALGGFFLCFFFDVVFYAQKNCPWRQKSQKMCPTAPKWLPKWSQKWSPNLLFLLLADPCFRATVQRFSKILGVPRVSGALQNASKNRSRNRGAKKTQKNN